MKKKSPLEEMNKTELLAEVRKLRRQLKLMDTAKVELQKAVDSIRENGENYRVLLEESNDPVFMISPDGIYRYANAAFAESVGKRLNKIIGKRIWDVFPEKDANNRFTIVKWVVENEETKVMDVRISQKDGDHYYISTAKPVFDDNHEVTSVICFSKEITERKKIEDELRYVISHDSLTGLYNRHFFQTELQRIQHSRLFPVSIVMIDLDKLKDTNDRYGQKTGDGVLIKVGALLKKTFRTEEIIARIGGDEFAVLLPETEETELLDIISRLNGDIKKEQDPLLKFSLGSATAKEGDSLTDLMQQAEAQLFQNKSSQQKRSLLNDPEMTHPELNRQ
jgi:diguanylate cyclase (GGDEF)-like protein/PAS domain S-box-containing protein